MVTGLAWAPGATLSDQVRVLFIAGWGRSGSTILDNVLGEVDGFFSGGEIHYLWRHGLIMGRPCGCGRTFESCEVWSRILERIPDARTRAGSDRLVRLQAASVRVRQTWKLLRMDPQVGLTGPLAEYADIMDRLYRAIAEVSRARVVVDSSKRPSDGALLRLLPSVSPYIVHMVRDPRAVAYSWKHGKELPTMGEGTRMAPHGAAASTLQWMFWNAAASGLRRRVGPDRSLLVRYEDFVQHPRRTLHDLERLVGEPPSDGGFVSDDTVTLGPNHTASGNPSRFQIGEVPITEDRRWIAAQSKAERRTVELLAAPQLHRYAYRLKP